MSSETIPVEASGLSSSASVIVLRLLNRLEAVDDALRAVIERGCLRSLDARSIIHGTPVGPQFHESETVAKPMGKLTSAGEVEAILESISRDGLTPHFLRLVGQFGLVLLELCGSEAQQSSAACWSEGSGGGAFLMTDRGGPSLVNWLSCVESDAEASYLAVRKIDAINAHRARFAIIAARRGRAPIPSLFLLSPDQYAALTLTPIGEAWLGGSFRLANVEGRVRLEADNPLTRGGFTGANMFLAIVRPLFVRALMTHLCQLDDTRRIQLSRVQRLAVRNVREIAEAASFRESYGALSIDEVAAVKFSSNELILEVVMSDAVPNAADRRDLLGFTKMEGSSYRCLFEIIEKRRKRYGRRDA